jgi:phage tail-like protein
MPPRELPPLLGTSHFRVLIGRRELGFSEVSRLTSATEWTVAADEQAHGFETVVLRRALSQSTELYDWRMKIVRGRNDRRPVTIQQLDATGGRIVNSWRLEGAWPCRWSGPAFSAVANEVAIEELELAYEELVWLTEPSTPPKPTSRSRNKSEGA